MGRRKYINGRPLVSRPSIMSSSERRAKSEEDNRKHQEKYESESKYFSNMLENIIVNALEDGKAVNDNKDELKKVFTKYNKQWVDTCSRVNRTNKVIKLNPAGFRNKLSQIINNQKSANESNEKE